VLEHLAGDDDIERLVGKRKLVLDVAPDGFDVETRRRACKCLVIDIDSDDGVAAGVVLR